MSMPTYGYDHLHFRSEDPHAARKFWEEMFGARVVDEGDLGGSPLFSFDLNGMHFLVSGRAEGENPVHTTSDPRYGLDHFGLIVDDMDKAESDLRAKGRRFHLRSVGDRAGNEDRLHPGAGRHQHRARLARVG